MRLPGLLLTAAVATVAMRVPEEGALTNGSRTLSSEGRSNSGRIDGGQTPFRGRFWYTAGVVADGGTMYCGGGLLSPRWVLTAAVCCQGYSYWDVWLGVQNMDLLEDTRVTITTAHCTIHPGFIADSASYWPKYNMAILDLSVYVTTTNYIRPAVLPVFASAGNYFAGQTAFFTGFGANGGGFSRQLLFTDCGGSSFTICATADSGHVIAEGDYGGPLTVLRSDNDYDIIGVASYVDAANSRTAFTLVVPYLTWIEQVTSISVS